MCSLPLRATLGPLTASSGPQSLCLKPLVERVHVRVLIRIPVRQCA